MPARPPIAADGAADAGGPWAGREPLPAGPDAWYFPAAGHEEAVARMLYLVEHGRPGGVLTGVSGVGKSRLLRMAAEEAEGLRRTVVPVDLAAGDVPAAAMTACGLLPSEGETDAGRESRLRAFLRGCQLAGRPVVVLADHADRPAAGAAEGLTRLLHLADERLGGVTLVLAGESMAADVAPLAARWCELRMDVPPLTKAETAGYLDGAAEACGGVRFEPEAAARLHAESGGVPRRLDRAARLAVLASMAEGRDSVAAEAVEATRAELPAAA